MISRAGAGSSSARLVLTSCSTACTSSSGLNTCSTLMLSSVWANLCSLKSLCLRSRICWIRIAEKALLVSKKYTGRLLCAKATFAASVRHSCVLPAQDSPHRS
uniref:Putative secreted protein n=1 Tax=Anopheles darlingi TaxID=43151 RepID=A0A2M4DDB9_ANODA